jgi:hypothetical protein
VGGRLRRKDHRGARHFAGLIPLRGHVLFPFRRKSPGMRWVGWLLSCGGLTVDSAMIVDRC